MTSARSLPSWQRRTLLKRRVGASVGAVNARVSGLMDDYGCSDTDRSDENRTRCKWMIIDTINKWVSGTFGDLSTASWKKAFLSRATTDENGTYWYSKTFQAVLDELGACPPSGFRSGPDCEPAGIAMVKAFDGVTVDADGQYRAYWPDFLIKMESETGTKLTPLPEDTGPTDPGWINRPSYDGKAEYYYPGGVKSAAAAAESSAEKLGFIPMGLRPISQSEQARPLPPPKPFNFGQKSKATNHEGIAFGVPTVLGGLAALRYGWVAFAAGGVIGLAAAGVVAAVHAIGSRT